MADNTATKPETAPEPRSGSSTTSTTLNAEGNAGKTTIASSVVQKVSGIAAGEVSGVYALGGGVSRAFGAIRERIPGSGTVTTSGVSVEVGEKQAAVDLDLVVEYGARIVDVAKAVRRNVISTVEQITGLDVIEVNIAVNDIHVPEEDDGEENTSRVE
ncbi:alkaline-shock protein [Prauserella marina]|uniref:Uncharacterized conserved protein YloU, alkaline shock protein (Asp23) family n=1 Tax=Prauserella marina TaxID=530584 RepID=A0A222VNP9_9PSEU|nr:Asp23/Gls24 family envelope stress response protein [Prauserella marina]ASR35504.1 alkaline-shock protein [Prauserella marina]PWV84670.1 putative alkaline shock family protein YloU [Prauserella marina]SDC16176.1 Uncharacterized conserved protein YloU, alkaline shock protein (Asp23) family [Prauserella marina]